MDSFNDVLAAAKEYCKQRLVDATYNLYIDGLEAVRFEGSGKVTLAVRNDFICTIVRDRYTPLLREALAAVLGFDVEVELVVPAAEKAEAPVPVEETVDTDGRYDFTFENFIKGPSNQFAYAAAQAVASNPSGAYNPLFIYGQSGLGKTHLLTAIATEIKKNHPNFNIVYVDCETFTNDLISAIQAGRTEEFRQTYRPADVLLVDDIQFIAGKESTQEEFFHTFNKLYEEHKQIVLTSDRKPDDMLTLEERLRSRFLWGITTEINPPNYETRMAILKNKATQLGLDLSDDVCNYIATNITTNVRQLEGTVKKILAYRDLNNMPLDLPHISGVINDMFKSEGNALPTPPLIISQVCKFYNVDESVLRGTQKNKGVAEPRQMAMYLIRKLTNLSLPDIGKEFGRDHTTVLYAIRKVEVALKNGDQTMQNNIRDITSNINSCL